jgi:hypothetical protein
VRYDVAAFGDYRAEMMADKFEQPSDGALLGLLRGEARERGSVLRVRWLGDNWLAAFMMKYPRDLKARGVLVAATAPGCRQALLDLALLAEVTATT